MTLPLPNLDTRRWSDLVEEGRAYIVRGSPDWTDHNLHDPGITLLELLAWAVERSIYRANRVPERHLRKFLQLAGFAPLPPRPAQVVLGLDLPPGTGSLDLPAGVIFRAAGAGAPASTTAAEGALPPIPFQTLDPVTLVEAKLAALHVFDGNTLGNRTRQLSEGLPVPLFGADPEVPEPYDPDEAPAFYLGFDRPLPIGRTLSLFARLEGVGPEELGRVLREAAEQAEECARPARECRPCPPPDDPWCREGRDLPGSSAEGSSSETGCSGETGGGATAGARSHHSVSLIWELHAPSGWIPLDTTLPAGEDTTRALTISGRLRFRIPAPMAPLRLGDDPADRFYIRARLLSGRYDEAPRLVRVTPNAVEAEQRVPVWEEFPLAPGHTGSGTLLIGARAPLALGFDDQGRISRLDAGLPGAPEVFALAHAPAAGSKPERLRLGVARLGRGSDLPGQVLDLAPDPLRGRVAGMEGCPPRCAPMRVVSGGLRLWSVPAEGPTPGTSWSPLPDLDASAPTGRDVAFDPSEASVAFGDGVRGTPLGRDETLLGSYALTLAGAGNVASDRSWSLAGHPLNPALLGADQGTVANAEVRNATAAEGGAEAEEVGEAFARAAAVLWAHERLVEVAEGAGVATLDRVDRATVMGCAAPLRASTTLDFERLALGVPGTRVRRARAWAGFDPSLGCARAPGTVTIVVVPGLPAGRPEPTPGLLGTVESYLDRRRLLGTRLVVTGPRYVEVGVRASVRAQRTADPDETALRVRRRLIELFDPLTGGREGRGWPFGRDVYAGEILDVIDRVAGVDHVLSLTLVADGVEVECDNVCVPTTGLVASATHLIEVKGP